MKNQKLSKKVKAVIAILSVLVILSAGALAVRLVYLNNLKNNQATSVVPDNLIGEEITSSESESYSSEGSSSTESSSSQSSSDVQGNKRPAAVVELYNGKPLHNENFNVINMLPGDKEVKYYAIKLSHHGDVSVDFSAEVLEQTKNLADVLNIKVTYLDNNKVLYNGSFSDMVSAGYNQLFKTNQSTETLAYYEIEVSLPTSVGNEYQAAALLAEFKWSVKDVDALDSPQTNDSGNIIMWIVLAVSALSLLVVLLLHRNKKEDENA